MLIDAYIEGGKEMFLLNTDHIISLKELGDVVMIGIGDENTPYRTKVPMHILREAFNGN